MKAFPDLFASRTIVQHMNNCGNVIPNTRPAAGAQRLTARRVPLSKELYG